MGTNTIFEVKRAIFFKISIPPHLRSIGNAIITWKNIFTIPT